MAREEEEEAQKEKIANETQQIAANHINISQLSQQSHMDELDDLQVDLKQMPNARKIKKPKKLNVEGTVDVDTASI